MSKDSRPGVGGQEPLPRENPEVEWPADWQERLDAAKWAPHMLPLGETSSVWEQIAPIPTFHWTEKSFDGKVTVDHLWYLDKSDRLGVNVAGRTLNEAEAKMRESLPFSIELGRGMIGDFAPTEPMKKTADEIAHYFRLKPQN